jgi:SAM-dependent methyltransferase
MKDQNFWNKHYSKFKDHEPSAFCRYCIEKEILSDDSVIELGCGNGKDGLKLMQGVAKYQGLDSSEAAILNFQSLISKKGNSFLKCGDFTDFKFSEESLTKRVAIYSRFSLHSITYAAQNRLFENISKIKQNNWVCMIEARSIYDELYGSGEKVGEHEFITDHYRRFLDPEVFLKDIIHMFKVKYFEISKGFSVYKEHDPRVIRVIFESKT